MPSRSCVQTVDRDVAVPNFDAVLNKWLLKIHRGQICLKKYPCLHPLLRRVYQGLPQVQSERASDHDTVTKQSNMVDDHRSLRHESLGDTCNRETFLAEILFPQMGEHVTCIWSFQFNRRSLAADIDYAEMIVVLQPQRFELLLSFLASYNKPPVRCKAQGMGFTSTGC